jgi:hypothetical protein
VAFLFNPTPTKMESKRATRVLPERLRLLSVWRKMGSKRLPPQQLATLRVAMRLFAGRPTRQRREPVCVEETRFKQQRHFETFVFLIMLIITLNKC